MKKAALLLFFLSPSAAASDTVNRAILFAAEQGHAMLVLHLSQTDLTPALRLMLNSQQAILRHECASDEAFFSKLFCAQPLQDLRVTPAAEARGKRDHMEHQRNHTSRRRDRDDLGGSQKHQGAHLNPALGSLGYEGTSHVDDFPVFMSMGPENQMESGGPSLKGYYVDYEAEENDRCSLL